MHLTLGYLRHSFLVAQEGFIIIAGHDTLNMNLKNGSFNGNGAHEGPTVRIRLHDEKIGVNPEVHENTLSLNPYDHNHPFQIGVLCDRVN